MARVLFLHGLHGSPNGIKVQRLRSVGHEVEAPRLPPESIRESLVRAREALEDRPVDIIVGSSRGGALALALGAKRTPVVVLAPAWRAYSPALQIPPVLTILHSPEDAVIPFQESQDLIRRWGLNRSILRSVGQDHSLNDSASATAMLEAILID